MAVLDIIVDVASRSIKVLPVVKFYHSERQFSWCGTWQSSNIKM